MVDPLIDPLKESIVMLCYESGDHGQSVIGYFMSALARPDNITFRANIKDIRYSINFENWVCLYRPWNGLETI